MGVVFGVLWTVNRPVAPLTTDEALVSAHWRSPLETTPSPSATSVPLWSPSAFALKTASLGCGDVSNGLYHGELGKVKLSFFFVSHLLLFLGYLPFSVFGMSDKFIEAGFFIANAAHLYDGRDGWA